MLAARPDSCRPRTCERSQGIGWPEGFVGLGQLARRSPTHLPSNLNRGQDTRANRTRHTTSSSTQPHAKQQLTKRSPDKPHVHTQGHTHTSRLTFGAANRSRSIARGRRAPEGGAKGVRRGGGSTILWSIVCVHHMPRAQPAGYAARRDTCAGTTTSCFTPLRQKLHRWCLSATPTRHVFAHIRATTCLPATEPRVGRA